MVPKVVAFSLLVLAVRDSKHYRHFTLNCLATQSIVLCCRRVKNVHLVGEKENETVSVLEGQ